MRATVPRSTGRRIETKHKLQPDTFFERTQMKTDEIIRKSPYGSTYFCYVNEIQTCPNEIINIINGASLYC
jgi:hypothetical protein